METKGEILENIPLKTYIDLETSCRICLIADIELILIFDPTNNIDGIPIATMINECSPYKAIRFDDYPQQICLKCVEHLKLAFAFRKHCEESHSIVNAYLNGGVEPSITDSKVIPDLDKCTQTEENSFFPCEKCDLKFFTFESLRLHRLYNHRGTKNECRICKKSFRRVGYLKGHYAMYHPELGFNENNNCDICGKKFERRITLRRHLEQVHKLSQNPLPINQNTYFKPEEDTIDLKDCEIKSNVKEISHRKKKFYKKSENSKSLSKKRHSKRRRKIPSPISDSIDSAEANLKIEAIKKIEIESSEDELPISKLKQEKIKICNEFLTSVPELDFVNDFFNNEQNTDSEDDKELVKQEMSNQDLRKVTEGKNQRKVNEILLPENIQFKSENVDNSAGLLDNTLNIDQLKNLNRNLKVRTCTICLKVFRFPHHLKRHMLARHSSEKQFKCTTCTTAFATPDYLKAHMKKCPIDRSISRARTKKYDCKGCEEKFSSTRALNSHVRAEHPNLFKKVFTCSYCPTSFETRHECTVHTNSLHENDKEYLCTECGQRFVRKRALEIHMRRHRGEKNHKCKFCGKGFVRAGDKDLHEKYHTGDKRFKCEVCGQGFVRNYSLRVHMRIHTGEKPYHCESCPRTFAQSNDLKTHVRRDHTGERYVCEINMCGETFLQLYLLNRHKKNVHNVFEVSHIQRVEKIYDVTGKDDGSLIVGK